MAIPVENYLPFAISRVTIRDAYGNEASGRGTSACCYTLRGTEFTVTWDYYDEDERIRGQKNTYHGEAKVSYRPEKASFRNKLATLAIHIFPDHHVELDFPNAILLEPRLPFRHAPQWMDRYPELDARFRLQGLPPRQPPMFDSYETRSRAIRRAMVDGWLKYRLTTIEDLGAYAYFRMAVNRRFDAHPDVEPLLATGRGKPGSVAKGLDRLSPAVMNDLRSDRFAAVGVPEIDPKLRPLAFEPDGPALRLRPREEPEDTAGRELPPGDVSIYWIDHASHALRRYSGFKPREDIVKLPPEKRPDGPWWFETHKDRRAAIRENVHEAWLKYELLEAEDLARYTYFKLDINETFDAHPAVHDILLDSRDVPGHFAKALDGLPLKVLSELKKNSFTPVSVPALAPHHEPEGAKAR
ncbi:hypothetical protein [Luteibacter sp.]|uniref:hypothetical protein n=1 Tax=Luteibacter sp. TaxID=1886636 RepID=UPI002F409059